MKARNKKTPFSFQGRGEHAELAGKLAEINPAGGEIGPWRRRAGEEGVDNADSHQHPDHPANYRASGELVDAVNTAIAIGKPLLLTGNPGTGKSQLAERIAWEFNLGPVLRFEAQSLSEANDLFYRFDLLGHMAAAQRFKNAREGVAGASAPDIDELRSDTAAENYVKIGPLGEAILRSSPHEHHLLFDAVFRNEGKAEQAEARASVVLIDEIDKAARDFPNDLLNGIERLEFSVRELGPERYVVNDTFRPIVIITSNSERDLPPAFLRRCTFFHIQDPTEDELEQIIAQKFFPDSRGNATDGTKLTLPPFYRELLARFMSFRLANEDALQYRPGTAEIINWTDALILRGVPGDASFTANIVDVKRARTTVSKHREDQDILEKFLDGLQNQAQTPAQPNPA
jgi:MoxR-like ATPase